MEKQKPADHIQGVRSVEHGLALFTALAQQGKACGLSDLARQAGMHRSKAHRYLVSLQRAGWVAQDTATGLYDLGPMLREMALAWLTRQNPLNLAFTEAHALAQNQGETCFVSVWGQGGATVIRVFQPPRAVSISIHEGTVLGPESSATGRVFEVWREPGSGRLSVACATAIKAQGLAVVHGEHVRGVNAIAAPVLDAQGRLLLTLTLVGPAPSLAADASGPAAQALLAVSRRLSQVQTTPARSTCPS